MKNKHKVDILVMTTSFMLDHSRSIDELEAHIDDVTDALMEHSSSESRLIDPDVIATLATGQVEITIRAVIVNGDIDEAVAFADAAMRSAIHAAEGNTSEWSPANWKPVEPSQKQLAHA